jgi:imidazolonepropionase-like amidohydrolase
MSFLFKNLNLLDPHWTEARGGYEVLVEGDTIKEVSPKPIRSKAARVIDCGKRTLMPGLIDCHVHTHHSEVYINRMEAVPLTLMMARSAGRLKRMLDRGFTTCAMPAAPTGAPRLPSNRGSSRDRGCSSPAARSGRPAATTTATGAPTSARRACAATAWCSSAASPTGPTRCARRRASRCARGDQVKLMVSGGVASPYDPLESLQFTEEEISAAVEEAKAFGRYVLTHAYTPEAITRAVKCGVRTIEHGNLVDAPTARLMARNGVYMIPNLVTYDAMKRRAKELGMPNEMLEKNDEVLKYGFAELEHCRKAGVKMAYGSDLLGALEDEQTGEFRIRGEVMPAIDVIRSATLIGAEVVRQEGKLGTIQPGAWADLLVVDGDPLKDLGLFKDGGPHLSAIMKGGRFHKNTL